MQVTAFVPLKNVCSQIVLSHHYKMVVHTLCTVHELSDIMVKLVNNIQLHTYNPTACLK